MQLADERKSVPLALENGGGLKDGERQKEVKHR
jgi:hypothetical protein